MMRTKELTVAFVAVLMTVGTVQAIITIDIATDLLCLLENLCKYYRHMIYPCPTERACSLNL